MVFPKFRRGAGFVISAHDDGGFLESIRVAGGSIIVKKRFPVFWALLVGILALTNHAVSQLASLQHEPELEWRTLSTEHFLIHFPDGFEQLGRRVAGICEEVYAPVSRSLNYFPGRTHVVIHTRVDFPEGVVSFLPWRMELYVTEPQGNISGSRDEWLRILIAHEFTHIVHLRKHKGLSTLTYPFLGEFNVLWQEIAPRWFTEGFATLNETRYTLGGAGRSPFNWMQMAAPVEAAKRWRLENTNYYSRKRAPPTRMRYVSGYYLSHFVSQRYGSNVWAKILDRYTAFPLLGFRRAVKSVTGESPKQLYGEMLEEFQTFSTQRESSAVAVHTWRRPRRPEDHNSPRWIDSDHLVVYRKSFDDLPELTEIDRTGRLRQVRERRLAKLDNSFTVGEKFLVWAELHPHPRFSATVYSDLKIYDRRTGNARFLTRNARVYSPDLSPDETQVVVVQTNLPTTRLVTVSVKTGEIKPVLEIPRTTLLNPRWSPDGEWIAFGLKDSTGRQDIAVLEVQTGRWRYLYPPDSWHDNNPCWTPDGRFILYVSDLTGIFNIWAVEFSTGERWMVTNSELGALTPDVSPDGKELAFKRYTYTGFVAATMVLDSTRWLPARLMKGGKEESVQLPSNPMLFLAGDLDSPMSPPASMVPVRTTPYRPWRQILRPQGWFPYPFKDESGRAVALFAMSQDALHRHMWQGSFGMSMKDFRTSVDFYYGYRRWWPELGVRTYNVPVQVTGETAASWWRRRGIELSVSLPLVLESNVYTTFFRPIFRLKRQTKRHSTGILYPTLQDYGGMQLGFDLGRTGQAIRDIAPHRAWFIAAFADWSSPSLGSEYSGQQFSSEIDVFLPTPIPHHQVELLGRYQNRRGNFNYAYFGALPIGYDDDRWVTPRQRQQLRLRVSYILPLAYLEWPIPFLPVYMDYLDASVGYDWGTSWEEEFGADGWRKAARYSAVIKMTGVNYFFQRLRVRLGVVIFYHSEERVWKSAPVIEYYF